MQLHISGNMMWLLGLTLVSLVPLIAGSACVYPDPMPSCPPRITPTPPALPVDTRCKELGGKCIDIRCSDCEDGTSCTPGLCEPLGPFRYCCLPDLSCDVLPSGVCMQQGHTHYNTFDGFNYQLQGRCKYLLAGDVDGTWSVCVEHQNQADYTRVKDIIIATPGGDEILYMNQNVKVNGSPKNDHTLEDGVVTPEWSLTMVGKANHVRLIRYCDNQGIIVDYDFEQLVIVRVDDRWMDKMQGLCGDYNADAGNDAIDTTTYNGLVIDGPCEPETNPGVCDGPGNPPTPAESLTECQTALTENPCPEVSTKGDETMCAYENCLCNQCLCEMAEAYQSKCYFLTLDDKHLEKPDACRGGGRG